jgi:adenine-specific DNA-methyltransferase
MEKLTDKDRESRSTDLAIENIDQLAVLFPDAFTEGAIDFDVLKQLLGGAIDDREEKYGLGWNGKRAARRVALTPSNGTLRPAPDESVDWERTQNLIIEGDNLEVLKLLQKSYHGKVNMIYIDPPYNTGNDFIYPDDFAETLQTYLQYTEQIDQEGKKSSTNIETDGRFHSRWLSMMYPRLFLARTLLRDDGVIFVSIDDGETANLRRIMDDIFGPENYLVTLYIQVRYADKTLAEKNDYQKLVEQVHVYQKRQFTPNKQSDEYTLDNFCWNITEKSAGRQAVIGGKNVTIFSESEFEITKVSPAIDGLKETWASGSVAKVNASGKYLATHLAPRRDEDGLGCLYKVEGVGDDGIGFRYFSGPKKSDATRGKFYSGVPIIRRQQLLAGDARKLKPVLNWYDFADAFGNCRHEGNIEFGSGKKPIAFLKMLINLATDGDEPSLVLDFFAGSGSTAHAVLDLNNADGGDRRFILVQLPEKIEDAEFHSIADITKERVRRVIAKLDEQQTGRLELGETRRQDRGFRVFKLDSSNIHTWNPDPTDLDGSLLASVEHLKLDRTEQDIFYELLLKFGLDLAIPIEQRIVASKTVISVAAGALVACLAESIDRSEIEELALGIAAWRAELDPAAETVVVFRDGAFVDDVSKTNITAILEQHGMPTVRSL